MTGRLDPREYLRELALRADEVRVARRELGALVLHDRGVLGRDLGFRIRQKLEGEAFLGAEVLVRLRGVDADAEDDRVQLRVLLGVALEVVRLERAAAGEVLRVEVEHDPFAAVVGELGGGAFVARQREIRRRGSDGGCGRFGRAGRQRRDGLLERAFLVQMFLRTGLLYFVFAILK